MHLALPFMPSLLAKELIELAAVPRTYVLRTLYAVGVFAVFLATSYRQLVALDAGEMGILGTGGDLFNSLMVLQFCGIYLFLPLLVAPLICEEDERGTLDLLMVSGISPLAFLLQKLFSRLIGMASFLLLALPIGGIAYALGGVSETQLIAGIISLSLCCIQVGSVALWCGARAHGTMNAVASAYLLGPVMLFIAAPLAHIIPMLFSSAIFEHGWSQGGFIIPMSLYYNVQEYSVRKSVVGTSEMLLAGLPIFLSAVGFVTLAWRALLLRRTTMSPTMRRQMQVYRPGVQFERHRRQRVVARAVDLETLPDKHPLAWRELRRTPIFRAEHRNRSMLGLIVLVSLSALFLLPTNDYNYSATKNSTFTIFEHGVYLAAIPLISVVAAGLMSGERKRNSLEILLLTPLDGYDLIAQKLAGCKRLVWLALALITYFAVVAFAFAATNPISWLRLPVTIITAWVYLHSTMWISMAVSLRTRVQTHAIVTILTLIVAWVTLPLLMVSFIGDLTHQNLKEVYWLDLLSPVSALIDDGQYSEYFEGHRRLALSHWIYRMILNTCWYGGIWWLVRRHCLKHADALLGRAC
jgi:ABC-type transport system involved in multi-copper enzyme maturation permease subunit